MLEGFIGVSMKIQEFAQIKLSCQPKFGFKPAVSYKLTPPATTCPPAPPPDIFISTNIHPLKFFKYSPNNIEGTMLYHIFSDPTILQRSLSSQTSLVNDLSYFELRLTVEVLHIIKNCKVFVMIFVIFQMFSLRLQMTKCHMGFCM